MLSFVLGLMCGAVLGAVGVFAARKIYWRVKMPPLVRRRFATLRFRRRVTLALRRRYYFPARALNSYGDWRSNYSLNKLLEKLDRAGSD